MAANDYITIPKLAAQIGVEVDRVRKKIRRRPELAALVESVGRTRVLPAGRVEDFRRLLGVN